MPDNEFQIEALGSVYAQALINEATRQNALAEVTEDIRGLGSLMQNNESFRNFIQSPTISEDKHSHSLEKILGGRVHALTLNVLKSLARRGRLMFLSGMVAAFEAALRRMEGRIDAELVSAIPIDTAAVHRIQDAVQQSTGKSVDLQTRFDPALIGGMTLTIGDTLIDGSVATQLLKIEDQLKRGGRLKAETVVA